jgi:hypothetical protein
MSTLKCLILVAMIAVITGCENDDSSNDHQTPSHPSTSTQEEQEGSSNEQVETYNDTRDVSTDKPLGGTVILVNNSSVAIYFTVNGDTKSVTPGQSRSWPYQNTATVSTTISGSFWSHKWNDGANHTYVAVDNGIPGGFDFI